MTPEQKLSALFAAEAPPARDYAFEARMAQAIALRRAWMTVAALVPWAVAADYGVRFTRPVVVDPLEGASVTVVAKVGVVGEGTARIDLTVTYNNETVLGKAQVQVTFS